MQSQIFDVKPCSPVVKGFIGKVIGKAFYQQAGKLIAVLTLLYISNRKDQGQLQELINNQAV